MASTQAGAGIGIANLPNQRHAIASKKGSALTMMIAGESGLGKTTFINTLFTTTIKAPKNHKRRFNKTTEKTVEIEIIRAENKMAFKESSIAPIKGNTQQETTPD